MTIDGVFTSELKELDFEASIVDSFKAVLLVVALENTTSFLVAVKRLEGILLDGVSIVTESTSANAEVFDTTLPDAVIAIEFCD